MKVLRLKDKSKVKDFLFKRGNGFICPVIDADHNYVISLNVLSDPSFEDLVEDILDMCELVEYKPFALDPPEQDTSVKEVKGEFREVLRESKDLEEAIGKYYNSKKSFFTKALEFVGLA